MTTHNNDSHQIETLAIHAGQPPDPHTGAVIPPIYQTSTYAQPTPGQHSGYEYSRTDNPTRTALQTCLAALENGKHGLAFASGMAATDTALRLVEPGQHVLAGDDVYGGTHRLFEQVLRGYGLEFTFADLSDPQTVAANLKPNTRLIWFETPTNPHLKLVDIPAIADIAHRHSQAHNTRALVAIDNTFATPYLQQPLTLGADLVVHSTTKYLGGHSDVVGGAILLNDDAIYERLKFLQNAIGAIPGPMDCWLVLRGLKTLALRMDRHAHNALEIAHYLEKHPAVRQVIYPGLLSHPQYDLARRQMRNGGGMISVVLHGGAEAARALAENTRLFTLAESLGGVESLIEVPAIMTHASVADSDLAVDPGLVRLSVGIENCTDLANDLAVALAG